MKLLRIFVIEQSKIDLTLESKRSKIDKNKGGAEQGIVEVGRYQIQEQVSIMCDKADD